MMRTLTSLLMLLSLAGSVRAVINDPAIYYKFDGDATDSSGNGRDATANGAPTYTTGQVGQAASFVSASSQYFSLTNAIVGTAGASYTVAFWCKASSFTTVHAAASAGDSGSNVFAIYPYDDINGNGIRVYDGAVTTFDNNAGVPTVNVFHHVALVVSSTSSATLYVDGSQLATNSSNHSLTSTGLNVGRWLGGSQYYDGQIDEFRLYTRPLSAGDVTELAAFTGANAAFPQVILSRDTRQLPLPHHKARKTETLFGIAI